MKKEKQWAYDHLPEWERRAYELHYCGRCAHGDTVGFGMVCDCKVLDSCRMPPFRNTGITPIEVANWFMPKLSNDEITTLKQETECDVIQHDKCTMFHLFPRRGRVPSYIKLFDDTMNKIKGREK